LTITHAQQFRPIVLLLWTNGSYARRSSGNYR
jgi:hypothetical protein